MVVASVASSFTPVQVFVFSFQESNIFVGKGGAEEGRGAMNLRSERKKKKQKENGQQKKRIKEEGKEKEKERDRDRENRREENSDCESHLSVDEGTYSAPPNGRDIPRLGIDLLIIFH